MKLTAMSRDGKRTAFDIAEKQQISIK